MPARACRNIRWSSGVALCSSSSKKTSASDCRCEKMASWQAKGSLRGSAESTRSSCADWPGAISHTCHAANFVPVRSGLTASASPVMTRRWNASLTYGAALGPPHKRSALLSFSVNSSSPGLASIEVIAAEHRVIGADRPRGTRRRRDGSKRGPFCTLVPGPGIAKPHARQQVKARRLGPAIARFDPHMDLFRGRLRIENFDIPIAILVKHPGVEEIEGRIAAAAPPVFGDEPFVGIGGLRVFVEIAQPAVARRSIDVEIVFLDVLAVVAFVAGQAEGTLFEDRVAAVPQRERETQALLLVAQSAEPVLVPAIGARARLVVAKMLPGFTMEAVILAHGAPGAFGQIRAPQ